MDSQFPFHRIDVTLLYPPFLEKLHQALEDCDALGATYVATLGFRTFEEQTELYEQGRTKPGHIVTNAPAGFSAHCYGLACDFVRMNDGVVSWAEEDYEVLGDAAEANGLIWGGRFSSPDRPHVQWPGYVNGEQLAALRNLFLGTDGMSAVWSHVTNNSKEFA